VSILKEGFRNLLRTLPWDGVCMHALEGTAPCSLYVCGTFWLVDDQNIFFLGKLVWPQIGYVACGVPTSQSKPGL
jgi:hypothetical protein